MKPTLIGYFLLFLIISLSSYLFISPVFKLQTINCRYSGLSQTCPESVNQSLEVYLNRFSLFLPLDQMRASIISANPEISQVDLNVILPDSLNVTLTPAQAIVTIFNPIHQWGTLIDDQMRVLQHLEIIPENYPQTLIYMTDFNLPSGSYLQPESNPYQAVQLFKKLQAASLTPQQIIFHTPDRLEVILPQSPTVLFSLLQSLERQVTALQLVLPAATMQLSSSQIDVRLEKPVILIGGENKVQ